jgi:hypothetical protein
VSAPTQLCDCAVFKGVQHWSALCSCMFVDACNGLALQGHTSTEGLRQGFCLRSGTTLKMLSVPHGLLDPAAHTPISQLTL